MKHAIQIVFVLPILLMCSLSVCAQDEVVSKSDATKDGFQWLQQFEGTWNVESFAPGSDKSLGGAVMKAQAVGEQWMVSKQNGMMGEKKFEAVQTVGFDKENNQFVGTWVDSTSSKTWQLTGSLDESKKKMTLNSEGADWSDPTKQRKYRDVYEFKSENEIASVSQMLDDDGKWQTFSTGKFLKQGTTMMRPAKGTVTPFLMFTGKAEEAIEYYKTVFPDLKVESVNKYKAGEAGAEGTIQLATFSVAGQKVLCTDSPPVHDFTFTPSFSFFVECEDLETLKDRFAKLSDGGKVMMPVNNYGFSDQFGWTSDKFGVSWQLNFNGE